MLQNIDYLMNSIDCLKIMIFSQYKVSRDQIFVVMKHMCYILDCLQSIGKIKDS